MTPTQIVQETIQVAADLEAFANDEYRIRGESFRYHATMIRHHAARLRLAVGCWPLLDIHSDPHECGLRHEDDDLPVTIDGRLQVPGSPACWHGRRLVEDCHDCMDLEDALSTQ